MPVSYKQAERLQKLPPYLFVRLEKLAAAMDGGRVREYTPGEDSSKSVMKTMTSR